MSDDVTREEFEALKERVAELESDSVENGSNPWLDHRDERVLSCMREDGKRSGHALVKLYLRRTDIRNESTAKTRAKALEQTEVYQDL